MFFPEQIELTKKDCVIICGDFGGVWDDSPADRYWLDWLEEKSFTTLFLDGNHENFDLLAAYPVEHWNGGLVQPVRPSVLHLMRGQVYTIQGSVFFTMGGAGSHDIAGGILDPDDPQFRRKRRQLERTGTQYRVARQSWWPEELPCEAEYQTARANLEQHNWSVDYILTHCCPTSLQRSLTNPSYHANHLTDFLEDVSQRCRFKRWFFGHYHDDRHLNPNYTLVHEQIIQLKP